MLFEGTHYTFILCNSRILCIIYRELYTSLDIHSDVSGQFQERRSLIHRKNYAWIERNLGAQNVDEKLLNFSMQMVWVALDPPDLAPNLGTFICLLWVTIGMTIENVQIISTSCGCGGRFQRS